MEDSIQRTYCSEWWAAQRRKERRKAPSTFSSVNLRLTSASFQTLLPSIYLRGQLIKSEKFYGGRSNILCSYPFPSAECWLCVTLYHGHPWKGGGSSLCCSMVYSVQCLGWLMFLLCMFMPVCGRAWPSRLLSISNESETWKDWYGTLKALMPLHTSLCLIILM